MSFTPEFLDELRGRLRLSEIVGRKVRLVRRGREFTGLCPFHSEKTPSFTVNDDKAFYHCFGCGAHGDAIRFLTDSEGLPFPEAVERLAGEAGLALPARDPQAEARAKARAGLKDVQAMAAKWFESQLWSASGSEGLAYLRRRGLDDQTIRRFALGHAPEGRTALLDGLKARGLDDAQLRDSGLIVYPEDGRPAIDRFRNRVMFPIRDVRGDVVAFGGRALGDVPAKYLNSPETPLFHKGNMLYNLDLARSAARDRGQIIVVEGYMDVIALNAAGFEQAVAPLGTALTEDQMRLLWRVSPEPVLCFDGDTAGMRAAGRAVERALPLLEPGYSLHFAILPAGEDPDSLVQSAGADAFTAVLGKGRSLAEMLWESLTRGVDIDTPERRAGLERAVMGRLNDIADNRVQSFYRDDFRARLRELFSPG
ncbi:MAG: DNA primase, partial [Sphingomonadales bacterium]